MFEAYLRDTTAKLSDKVADLEDVRSVMLTIKEVSCLTWCPKPGCHSGVQYACSRRDEKIYQTSLPPQE